MSVGAAKPNVLTAGDKPLPDFSTPHELAARWRVGVSTVYRRIEEGKLPYVKELGPIRIHRDVVLAFEASGKAQVVDMVRESRRAIRVVRNRRAMAGAVQSNHLGLTESNG